MRALVYKKKIWKKKVLSLGILQKNGEKGVALRPEYNKKITSLVLTCGKIEQPIVNEVGYTQIMQMTD